jgi:hypothetical protein
LHEKISKLSPKTQISIPPTAEIPWGSKDERLFKQGDKKNRRKEINDDDKLIKQPKKLTLFQLEFVARLLCKRA